MDQKLLDSLNNLSVALESIVDALSSKKPSNSATSTALKSGNLTEQLKSIDKGIKELKKDNKEILKNQKTILGISKEKGNDKTTDVKDAGGKNKEKIKQGLGTILMIAVGVLAIGLAFKLIGGVDFLSVLALAIALPLVAMAFEKIASSKSLNAANIKSVLLVTLGMSIAIAASSWILQTVKPVGFTQLVTVVFIAAAFAALSFSIGKLTMGMKKADISQVWKLPIVLVAASLAIAASSWILQSVKPVGFFQLVTVVFIAAAFAALSFSLGKLSEGVGKVDTKDVWKLPVVLIAASIAIAASSWILQTVKPVGFFQLLTTILISAAFVVISYGLPMLAKAMEKINVGKILLMPIVMVAMAAAIVGASWIFQEVKTIPFFTLLNIVVQAAALAVIGVVLGLSMWVLAKVGLSNILQGSIAIVMIAGAIALSSQILSMGDYTKFPSMQWSIGTGLSLLSFGLAAAGLGVIMMSGVGALALLAGAGAILGIAGTIVLTAEILSKGNFAKYPSFEWSKSVALSMATFGAGMLLTGTFIVGSLGLGGLALAAGAGAMTTIAESIVEVGEILGKGKFTGGPTETWSRSVGMAIAAFAPVYATLGDGILGLFGGKSTSKKDAIIGISQGIVDAAGFFSKNKAAFRNPPPVAWSEGVGKAIAAFAPVYSSLGDSVLSLFGGKDKATTMREAIVGISNGIIEAANVFNGSESTFDLTKVPKKEWGEAVGGAIAAFSPVFKFLGENSGFFGADIDDLNEGVVSIAKSIVDVSKELVKGNYTSTLPPNFISSVASNIKAYIGLINYLDKKGVGSNSITKALDISKGISKLSKGYNELSNGIKNLSSSINGIDVEKLSALKSLTGSIVLMSLMDSVQFESMMDALENKAKIFVDVINELDNTTTKGTKGSITPIKSSSAPNTNEKSITDLYNKLSTMDARLASIDKSSRNLSSILDEIRSSDTNLKKKKV
jgi:hypothetical protein